MQQEQPEVPPNGFDSTFDLIFLFHRYHEVFIVRGGLSIGLAGWAFCQFFPMENDIEPKYLKTLGPGCFRLMRFDRRSSDVQLDRPACRISNYLLSEAPQYIALSYAWNEPCALTGIETSDRKLVNINDHIAPVAQNLFYALDHLSSKQCNDSIEHFWVDALCIDQSSDHERTAQVSIMDQIYRQATTVLVWLGPDLKNEAYTVREVFRALLQKYYHDDDCGNGGFGAQKYEIDFLCQNDERDLQDAGLPSLHSDTWKQVVKFWDRGWFSRVWVQQEVALAQQVSFWCGEIEFTQAELVECSRFFVVSGLSTTLMVMRLPDGGNEQKTVQGRKVGGSAIRIPGLQAWMTGSNLSEPDDTKQAADRMTGPAIVDTEGKVAHPLLRIFAVELYLTFRDDCTDPRDRIFALLVLMKQAATIHGLVPLPIQIDYARSITNVFLDTVAWVINSTGWLGMLSLIHPGRADIGDSISTPSWVPNFCTPPPSPLVLFEPDMDDWIDLRASMTTAETRPQVQVSSLFVSARRVGIVQEVGNSNEDHLEHGMFEATANLLLNIPDEIWPDYTRVDYWTDAMDCKMVPSTDRDDDERRNDLRHWLVFAILRKIAQDFRAGRISKGREHLAKMPSLETLALADITKTLPTWDDWSTEYSQAESQLAVLNRRPHLKFEGAWSRRLFRLVDLGFPHCPPASLLGIGPDGIMPGDEVFEVVGSVLPLVLRRKIPLAHGTMSQAQVVGESFMTGFNDIVSRMDGQVYERWELI